jgi:hypothetical protein
MPPIGVGENPWRTSWSTFAFRAAVTAMPVWPKKTRTPLAK